jgi:hypothetical protein
VPTPILRLSRRTNAEALAVLSHQILRDLKQTIDSFPPIRRGLFDAISPRLGVARGKRTSPRKK